MAKKNKSKKTTKKVQANKPFVFEGNWYALIVIAFAFLLYANTIEHGFVLDDDLVCAKNDFVKEGQIGKILTTSYHEAFTGKPDRNYRPLTMVAFAIENNFSGEDKTTQPSPTVFHFFNILWYAIACGLLFIFMRYLFGKEHFWLPLGISLLFAAHPIHTEVVANIKSRDEIFIFIGMIATLYSILKYDETGLLKWLGISLFSYFLACLTKENGLPIVGLVPITLYFFGKQNDFKSIATHTAYFFIPVAFYAFMNYSFTGDNGDTLGVIDNILYTEGITVGERVATAIGMIGEYLKLLFFPHPLSYDYSAYQIPIMNWSSPMVFISLLATVAILALAIKLLPSKHPISWAILLFATMFVLVSNLFFIIGTTMAERLLFSPSLGFCLILGYLLYQYLYKKDNQILFYVAIGAIIGLYSIKTFTRNDVWKSNKTLHVSGMTTAPNSARALSFYGKRLYDDALLEQDANKKRELANNAIQYYDRAIEQVPSFRDAYHNKALCYLEGLNQYDQAIQSFDQAIALDNDYHLSICGKGIAYHKKGDNTTALQFLNQAHDIAPNNNTITQNLINILLKVRDMYRNQGDIETAISYDKQVKALRGEPIN